MSSRVQLLTHALTQHAPERLLRGPPSPPTVNKTSNVFVCGGRAGTLKHGALKCQPERSELPNRDSKGVTGDPGGALQLGGGG